jgi:hypothetical protein
MLLSRHQNVGQNWDIKIANRSFENVSQFKYLGTAVTNQNPHITKNTKSYYLLSSRLLLRNVKIRIYKTLILPVALYVCETWSLDSKGGT